MRVASSASSWPGSEDCDASSSRRARACAHQGEVAGEGWHQLPSGARRCQGGTMDGEMCAMMCTTLTVARHTSDVHRVCVRCKESAAATAGYVYCRTGHNMPHPRAPPKSNVLKLEPLWPTCLWLLRALYSTTCECLLCNCAMLKLQHRSQSAANVRPPDGLQEIWAPAAACPWAASLSAGAQATLFKAGGWVGGELQSSRCLAGRPGGRWACAATAAASVHPR